jgi:hypothetical protein
MKKAFLTIAVLLVMVAFSCQKQDLNPTSDKNPCVTTQQSATSNQPKEDAKMLIQPNLISKKIVTATCPVCNYQWQGTCGGGSNNMPVSCPRCGHWFEKKDITVGDCLN